MSDEPINLKENVEQDDFELCEIYSVNRICVADTFAFTIVDNLF